MPDNNANASERDNTWIPPYLRRSRAGRLALRAKDRSSISSNFEDNSDHSTNKPLPWIVIACALAAVAGIIAAFAFGLALGNESRITDARADAQAQAQALRADFKAQLDAEKTRVSDLAASAQSRVTDIADASRSQIAAEAAHVREQTARMEKEFRLLENDWQESNAFQAAHGICRDARNKQYFCEVTKP